ncbi:DUF2189 domain-containing protein [Nocardia callitridis]|uniref:Integral membrane protein n=1 Tax=Nocardia callitridis TaxID=648753 RepID=A0ABP9KBS0_9NOCA
MTDTPPHAPKDSGGTAPDPADEHTRAEPERRGSASAPEPPGPGTGYPHLEGSGTVQYGVEQPETASAHQAPPSHAQPSTAPPAAEQPGTEHHGGAQTPSGTGQYDQGPDTGYPRAEPTYGPPGTGPQAAAQQPAAPTATPVAPARGQQYQTPQYADYQQYNPYPEYPEQSGYQQGQQEYHQAQTMPIGDQPTYGYQRAKGRSGNLDVGQALSYGWDTFRTNAGAWLGVTAIGFVIYLAFVIVVQLTEPTSMLPVLLLFLAVSVCFWLLQAAMLRGALYESDGNRPPFGSFFRNLNAGNVLLTAVLVLVLASIGALFCVIPGIAVGVLCMFSLNFVLDQDMGPFQAIKSSVLLVVANPVQVSLLALAVLLMTVATVFTCGIGLLVVGPLSALAVTFSYRTLNGGRITAY